MSECSFSKAETRKKFLSIRDSVDDLQRKKAVDAALGHLFSLGELSSAESLFIYYPIKNEPDVLPLISFAKETGKTVAFPRCNKQDLTLSFFKVESLADLVVGAYGIHEPSEKLPQATPGEKTLCIVPGVAFSRDGHRIGYGKGFYDRFLSGFSGTSVGVTFEALLTDTLPRDDFDQKLDIIITEKGVYRIER